MNIQTTRIMCVAVLAVALPALIGCAVCGARAAEHAAASAPASRPAGAVLRSWSFDKESPRTVPAGWDIRQTRPTTSLATWQVLADPTAPSQPNVLALTKTDNYDGTFNLAMAESTSFKDLDLTVKVKAVRGDEDQGGGPIWRGKDENNYYISRFNPLEGNFRVYKVVDSRRKQLDTASVETEPGKWYAVRVTMVGNQITCYLNGKKLLETTDETFKNVGMVGFWTKADAVTSFDDLTVREIASDG